MKLFNHAKSIKPSAAPSVSIPTSTKAVQFGTPTIVNTAPAQPAQPMNISGPGTYPISSIVGLRFQKLMIEWNSSCVGEHVASAFRESLLDFDSR